VAWARNARKTPPPVAILLFCACQMRLSRYGYLATVKQRPCLESSPLATAVSSLSTILVFSRHTTLRLSTLIHLDDVMWCLQILSCSERSRVSMHKPSRLVFTLLSPTVADIPGNLFDGGTAFRGGRVRYTGHGLLPWPSISEASPTISVRMSSRCFNISSHGTQIRHLFSLLPTVSPQSILIRIWYSYLNRWGTRWRSWLRQYATSREVASSIPSEVLGCFI
jgi:hypothetical protein